MPHAGDVCEAGDEQFSCRSFIDAGVTANCSTRSLPDPAKNQTRIGTAAPEPLPESKADAGSASHRLRDWLDAETGDIAFRPGAAHVAHVSNDAVLLVYAVAYAGCITVGRSMPG
jgi:hypothetical protein